MPQPRRNWLIVVTLLSFGAVAILVLQLRAAPAPAERPFGSPSGSLPRAVAVTRADIRSVVVLDGAIAAAPIEAVRSPIAGTVVDIVADEGAVVRAGDRLFTVKASTGGSSPVAAPAAGTLLSISAQQLQPVHAGQSLATLAPRAYQAVATVDPSRLYRLYQPPVSVRVQIERGPAPFDCPFASLGAEVAAGDNPYDAPITFRCSIPDGVRVFAGIRVRIAVVTGEALNALNVPVEAVEGAADNGWVTLLLADGSRSRRSVKLGITDGLRIQILDGLAEGDRILDPPQLDAGSAASGSP
jgi:multidrug efflux pump subunit AcrA (membrane-fusion protein)